MASKRGQLAAERAAAAEVRARQLQERLDRLQAGEASTHEDVLLARAAAARQRAETRRAQEQLRRSHAVADLQHPPLSTTPPADRDAGSSRTRSTDDEGAVQALRAANTALRHGLVSIASSGTGLGSWSKERRQQLWLDLTDQCGQDAWQGWSHALCLVAESMVPGVRGVAISGYDSQGVPHLLAVSDEWTRQAEDIAQLVGEGPGVEAHRTQARVLVASLVDSQPRWPAYVDVATSAGVGRLCALPVQLEGVGLGVLTLYAHDDARDGWHAWLDGRFLAAVAAKALLADLDAAEGLPAGDLGDDRIQAATGMLSVQLDVDVEQASVLLRAFAFGETRTLVEVADAVIDGSLRIV